MSLPWLSSIISDLEIKEVEKREAAFISLVESPDSISKFRLEREFLTNNFSLFEVSGDFVFQDIKLSTDADILSNFCFENVHHFDFVSNGIVLKHFPKDVVIVAMPYSEPHVRLYFKRDDIPASFKMSYDCLFVHTNKRQKLRSGVMTTHHKYSDGVIAELE